MSANPLVVAVPSKGRLQENAAAFFARAGLTFVQGRGARDYRGVLSGVDNVQVAFLSAGEITRNLAEGSVHMGVTGEDLVRETIPDVDARVVLLTPLGFGEANVVVAVPRAWIDVRTMADLADVAASFRGRRGERMRVATKYVHLTRTCFANHGVGDYRIVESLGATEGAPAAGQAELIVDITTTGATLEANALKVLDDGIILRSEANLVASLSAQWDESNREAARKILARIAAEEEARTTRDVAARVPDVGEPELAEAATLFGAKLRRRVADGGLVLGCPKNHVASLADWLIGHGAESVTAFQNDYVFSARNVLWETLDQRLHATLSARASG
jgi:ATP phosphoribosyltransferase